MKKRQTTFKLNTGVTVLATVSGQEEPHPVIYRNLTQAERKAKEIGGTVYQSRHSRSNFFVIPPRAHYTVCEDGSVIVVIDGQQVSAPSTWQMARVVALNCGFTNPLPLWDACAGRFVALAA